MSSPTHFDLIVIGTGPAGGTVARKVAETGKRVAIVDERTFGGTCALRGCNPKKVYVNAGQLVDRVRRSNDQLVADASTRIDWVKLHAFKETFTRPVAEGSEASFQDSGITTLHGTAKFIGVSTLSIAGEFYEAERIVIATGGRPRTLNFPNSACLISSDDFLDLSQLPRHIAFVGGGYISMEFAHVAARAGSRVTIIEKNSGVLSGFDPDLVKTLTAHSHQQGIQFLLNQTIEGIDVLGDESRRIKLRDGQTVSADCVVHGAGRVPNIDRMQLDVAGIQHDQDGVSVDAHLRSQSNERVYAVGDCARTAQPRLTPVANEDARIVAKNLFADRPVRSPDYGMVPRACFTTPAIASVGLSEEQACQTSADLEVRTGDMSDWSSVRKTGKTVAGYKVLIDRDSDAILGAHLLGPGAEETINLFAMAMKHNLTAADVKSTLFVFPSFSHDIRQMI
ncbi:dihydrolipoyl dehydrogenase family protein [Crateriforma spongiae]|uniref:dihydrolipoyl dehydrogenase family protein n=1 Tax=Crateriforma spongiae TaxID=2724528 RepID=UPI00144570B8|nr:NAD(P)/FAD-dependent oxidoreductase [Crateriforma spongiae]